MEFTEFSLISEVGFLVRSHWFRQPQSVVRCVTGGPRHPRATSSLPVTPAPVGDRVPGQIPLHDINVAFFLYAACKHLQHQPEPAVHGPEMRLDEDGGQPVAQKGLLHQRAQLVLLFGQQLETQVRGLPHSVNTDGITEEAISDWNSDIRILHTNVF